MKTPILAAGLAAVALASGCGSSDDAVSGDSSASDGSTAAAAPAATATTAAKAPAKAKAKTAGEVEIKDFDYAPSPLAVAAGAKVTWTNRDTANHTVTFDAGAQRSLGNQPKGKAVSFTFAKAGTYAYHCDFHPNMHGTVVVR